MKIKKINKVESGTGEITMGYAEQTFKELLAFQGYGFCLGYDVPVIERTRGEVPVGSIKVGEFVLTPGGKDGERWAEVINVIPQGHKPLYEVKFSNMKILRMTLDHPLLCEDGMLRNTSQILDLYAEKKQCSVMFRNMRPERIVCVTYLGDMPVMDISIDSQSHLFYADTCIVHNCKAHATSYSVYSVVQMWLQEHYFQEYMCALLRHIDRAKEKKGVGVLNERVEYCMKHGMTIYYPDVSASTEKWEITPGGLLAPLKNIKGFSDREVKTIMENRPYNDLADFLDKTKFNSKRFETLLFSHALNRWGEIEYLYNWYYNHYDNKDGKTRKIKKSESMSLFDEPSEDSSSSEPEIIKAFTKSELDEKCLDLNGFVINENVQVKYHEFFERGMEKVAELKHDESYNSPRRRIYKLNEAIQKEVKEDSYKNMWVLAKVVSEARNIPSKWGGNTFDKITVNDGYTSVVITSRTIPKAFKKGSVLVFPISINDKNKIMIDKIKSDNFDIVILEKE